MPAQSLSYGSTSDPLDVHHSCQAPAGVSVSGRTSLGTSFDLQPGAPFHHTIAPPLPPTMQTLYVVVGPPHAPYQIETQVTQGDVSDRVIGTGTLSNARKRARQC